MACLPRIAKTDPDSTAPGATAGLPSSGARFRTTGLHELGSCREGAWPAFLYARSKRALGGTPGAQRRAWSHGERTPDLADIRHFQQGRLLACVVNHFASKWPTVLLRVLINAEATFDDQRGREME